MRTIKELAKEALDVQDACNLSAVVHTFSKVVTELRELMRDVGTFSTDNFNRHPIIIMYSSKIASLCGSENATEFSSAYAWVEDMAGKRPIG